MMTSDNKQKLKFLRAKDRVKRIRGFYGHAAIFCIVIVLALLAPLAGFNFCLICFSDASFNLIGFAPWIVGLCIHGLLAFGKIGFIKKWEEKKLKEFLKDS